MSESHTTPEEVEIAPESDDSVTRQPDVPVEPEVKKQRLAQEALIGRGTAANSQPIKGSQEAESDDGSDETWEDPLDQAKEIDVGGIFYIPGLSECVSDLDPQWVRLVPNGTNLRLFKIIEVIIYKSTLSAFFFFSIFALYKCLVFSILLYYLLADS